VGHRASQPRERLPDRAALAAWLREAGLTATGTPVSDADVAAARLLREAIAAVAASVVDAREPDHAAVAAINEAAAALPPPRLEPAVGTIRPAAATVRDALARVAADAIATMTTRRADLVRCALPECGALLLSSSNGPRRRWCAMSTCGNVAKARAHRERKRPSQTR
jgi:predicted RNA-binding Zn ribbon-like protein